MTKYENILVDFIKALHINQAKVTFPQNNLMVNHVWTCCYKQAINRVNRDRHEDFKRTFINSKLISKQTGFRRFRYDLENGKF